MIEYFIRMRGNCLGPGVPDGAPLGINPTAEIRPLDLCAAMLRPGSNYAKALQSFSGDSSGQVEGIGKFYLDRGVRMGREILLLGQLWPAGFAVVPVEDVIALHRIDHIEDGGNSDRWGPMAEEVQLIMWARGDEPTQPINPDWRPPMEKAA